MALQVFNWRMDMGAGSDTQFAVNKVFTATQAA